MILYYCPTGLLETITKPEDDWLGQQNEEEQRDHSLEYDNQIPPALLQRRGRGFGSPRSARLTHGAVAWLLVGGRQTRVAADATHTKDSSIIPISFSLQ